MLETCIDIALVLIVVFVFLRAQPRRPRQPEKKLSSAELRAGATARYYEWIV